MCESIYTLLCVYVASYVWISLHFLIFWLQKLDAKGYPGLKLMM